jgi:hypothetical protein
MRRLELSLVIFDSWWCSQNFDTNLLLPENKLIGLKKRNWDVSGFGRTLQAVSFHVPVSAVPIQIGLYQATQNL